MQVEVISDLVEARRARLAQYHGLPRTFQLNGRAVTGSVKSVVPDPSLITWTVKFLPTAAIVDRKYDLRRAG